KNLIWEYTERFISSPKGQQIRKQYDGKFPEFSRNFTIDDKMFADFLALAKSKEIEVAPDNLTADGEYLRNRLKARIARSFWGNNEFYQVSLKDDKQYETALSLFPEAARVARLTMR